MTPTPDWNNPSAGTWNTAFPVPNGGVASTFTAFGWLRVLFADGIPEFFGDMQYAAGLTGGVLV